MHTEFLGVHSGWLIMVLCRCRFLSRTGCGNGCFCVCPVRIQIYFCDITPVSGRPGVPALRMLCLRRFIDLMAFSENSGAFSVVALCWCQKPDPAVMMLITVPFDECRTPCAGVFQCIEAFRLVIRTVLERLEQGFRVRE